MYFNSCTVSKDIVRSVVNTVFGSSVAGVIKF